MYPLSSLLLLPAPLLLPALLFLPALLAGRALLAIDRALPAWRPGWRPAGDHPARRPGGGRDAGMSTAEYAVGTVAAVAFAGVLYAAVSSSATQDMIMSIVRRALSAPF
ncbi:DUF4244 domain-containing protein [Frankia sp. CNm7]|uniref:DUF4244 domain-containing protein n=2 Tax=Frankia nepalensis TaxID=1836974 RepID=A0A937RL25_9ACTN|nr:DUF4244 domain-containing protein [Frankia nepalensis]MBL7496250.1 DUF4244 domain-containing protein [Frankia nepalensis]MBL7516397.1 DUF4244 domain-containing protein [Frankia nepalensis]MBL7519773.1 DUF4244 domain-containing protein [Frankia nepalensis]MBL7632240.1 DUF4244 domain-containing protein [Frankia nepalensis]